MSLSTRSRDCWLPGVLRRQPGFSGGLRDWLASCQWDPEAGMTKKKVSMAIHSTDAFADACVNDAIRLASVAFESAAAREPRAGNASACAWQFIKYYYAGYFAANALMRLCGHASTNLGAVDCTSINEQAALYSVGGHDDRNKLAPGVFNVQFNGGRTPHVMLWSASGKGGAHVQFWSGFQKFLVSLRQDIRASTAPPAERDAALAELAALTAELQRDGNSNGAWLSEMRNSVNYRFEHGLWYPYENSSADAETLLDAFSRGAARSTPIVGMATALPSPIRAARSCAFLLSWLKDSMEIIEGVSRGRKKTLIARGVLSFAANV